MRVLVPSRGTVQIDPQSTKIVDIERDASTAKQDDFPPLSITLVEPNKLDEVMVKVFKWKLKSVTATDSKAEDASYVRVPLSNIVGVQMGTVDSSALESVLTDSTPSVGGAPAAPAMKPVVPVGISTAVEPIKLNVNPMKEGEKLAKQEEEKDDEEEDQEDQAEFKVMADKVGRVLEEFPELKHSYHAFGK